MLLIPFISSVLFILLSGAKISLQQKELATPQNGEAPRAVIPALLDLGMIASLVLLAASLARWSLTFNGVPNSLLIILCIVISAGLCILFLVLAYKLFSQQNLPSQRFLFRNLNDESKSKPSSVDANPALEYLGYASEEEKDSAEILDNALDLYGIQIRECLIPRNEIISVALDEEVAIVKNIFIESKHSKLIVYENDIDKIVGYVHHSDFYQNPESIEKLVREIPTVPESMTAIEMLSFFKRKQKSIAWVVDEFGGTAGILTTEDLLEELFGEIEDEHDESEYIEQQISNDEIILSGRLEVEYINEKFDLELPTESAETISGYIIEEYNEIPDKNEKIIIGPYEFKILKVSKTRIETLRLKVLEK